MCLLVKHLSFICPLKRALTKRGSSLAVRTRKFSRRTPAVSAKLGSCFRGGETVSPDQRGEQLFNLWRLSYFVRHGD